MKQGWEIKSLGEIADVEYGFTDKAVEEGDYRYVRITDIDSNGELIPTEKKYLKHSKEAEGFLIRDKDLLMARTGATFAKVLLYQDFEPSVFASYLIRINFKEKVENKLYWYFTKTKSYWEQANSLASGAAQPHFNGAAVKQIVFSYPKSFQEQQRIVAILDDAFAKIEKAKANTEQNLKNAKELFESYLQGVFENKGDDWEEKKLKELYRIGSSKRVLKSQWKTEGIPFYRGREITKLAANGFVDNELFISEVQFAELLEKTGVPKTGDIVMTAIGTIGNTHIVRDFDKFYFKDASVLWLKRVTDTSSEFTKYFLKSSLFFRQLDKGNGATVDTLTIDKLQNIQLFIPTFKTQQIIVEKLNSLSKETKKLETIYNKKIKDLEELKKSVLQKAFSGEI